MWRPSLQRKLFGYQEVQCFLKVLSADLLPFSSSYRVSPAIAICLYSNSQPVIKSQDPSFQQRQTSHYSNVSFLAHPNWWFPITPWMKWLSIILAYIWAPWCHVPFRIWGSHCAYNIHCGAPRMERLPFFRTSVMPLNMRQWEVLFSLMVTSWGFCYLFPLEASIRSWSSFRKILLKVWISHWKIC